MKHARRFSDARARLSLSACKGTDRFLCMEVLSNDMAKSKRGKRKAVKKEFPNFFVDLAKRYPARI